MNWGAVQAVVGVIALLVLLWYAWHTMKLRFETQRQVRLSSLPVARVEFLRGPDRVFIRNSGGAIIAKAALQGFRFRGPDGGVWRCTFSPTTMLSPGASSASVFENITLEGYEGAPMLDQRALFEIAFSQAFRGRSSIRLALYYRQQMKTGSSTPVLPLHILYRLALSKYFVREAKAKLQHSSDDLALSLVVVNLYDGLDNLLGAVASRLSIDLQEKASLVSTFESISRVEVIPHKMEILQLNALRIDTKHKGLVPNPKVVLSLAPVLEQFCDHICLRFFDKSLMQVSLVDAIEDSRLRERMRQVEGLIDTGMYKDALELMSVVLFEEFDYMYIDESGGIGPIFAGTSPIAQPQPLPEEQKRVFPSLRVDHVHRLFLEMGIEPDLYHRFHNIVPKVGYDNLRDRNLIIEKDRSTWHMKNWTRENSWFCFDFLTGYFVRRQKGYKGYTIIRRHWKDKIRFIRDSTMYEYVAGLEGQVEGIMMKAGASLIGSAKDYVDGAWQGDPENPFADVTLFVESPEVIRFARVLKEDVEVVADEEVEDVPFTPW